MIEPNSTTKHKPYPAYKPSGVDWLGEIPEHWEIHRGKNIFTHKKEINNGMKCDNVLALTMGGVINKDISSNKGLLPSDYSTYQIFHKDDLVFKLIDLENIKTSRVGLVHETGIMSSAYMRMCPKKKIIPRYYFYKYYHLYIRHVFNSLGAGVRSTLNSKDLLELLIQIPPLSEQRTIANFLDHHTAKIDALIAKKERLIELLEEKRAALISQAVTKGLNPDVEMKESGVECLGEIPVHWDLKKLKYLVTINDESLGENSDSECKILYVDIGSVDKHKGITHIEDYYFEKAPSRARRIVRDGDVIISTVRTYLRAIAPIVNPPDNLIVSTGFAVIRPLQELNSHFASFVLRTPYFVDSVVAHSFGVSYPAINASKLGTFYIAYPPEEEQKEIVIFIQSMISEFDNLREKTVNIIAKLQEYRTALISVAVTGKIDVREWND